MGQSRDVDAVEHDLPLVGLDHAAGHAEAGGLAGAVGAEQADDLGLIDVEADAIDHPAAAVGFDKSFRFQDWHSVLRDELQVQSFKFEVQS